MFLSFWTNTFSVELIFQFLSNQVLSIFYSVGGGGNICSYIFHGAYTPPLYILMQSYNNHCMDRIGGFPEAVPSINYIGRQLDISYIGREMYGESVLFKRVLPWVISVRVLSDHKHIHATPIDGKIIVLQRTWTTRPLSRRTGLWDHHILPNLIHFKSSPYLLRFQPHGYLINKL